MLSTAPVLREPRAWAHSRRGSPVPGGCPEPAGDLAALISDPRPCCPQPELPLGCRTAPRARWGCSPAAGFIWSYLRSKLPCWLSHIPELCGNSRAARPGLLLPRAHPGRALAWGEQNAAHPVRTVGAGGRGGLGHAVHLPPPPWQGWGWAGAKLRSLPQRWALPHSPAWEGKGWSQGPVPCRVCAAARQEGVAALWAPGVPSPCPQDLGVLRVPGTGGGRNLPSPPHERAGSRRVSAVPCAAAPGAARGMGTLVLTQPLSSVCLCLQEPPSV